MDSNIDAFLRLYNELDKAMRVRLGVTRPHTPHHDLINRMADRDPVFRQQATRLHAYRALRNSLVHIPVSGSEEPIAEPRKDVVAHYERLVRYVQRPPQALDVIAIRAEDIWSRDWSDPVVPALKHMLENGFRLTPIICEGRLEGMFTESALMQKLVRDGELSVDEEVTFSELRDELVFGEEVSPTGVEFIASDASIEAVEAHFRAAFAEGRFISVVCMTPNARSHETLDGIVTAHDLPSANGAANFVF